MRTLAATILALCSGVLLSGQYAEPRFDVVSIKRNTGETLSFSVRTTPDGTTTVTNLSVSGLIMRASVPELPRVLENLPEWASDRYDVTLKGPAGSKPVPDTWRNLLAQRFK